MGRGLAGRTALRLTLAAVVVVGGARHVEGQAVFRLTPNRTLLGLSFDGYRLSNDPGRSSRQTGFREWAVIPVSGHLLDPGIFRWAVELKPQLRQNYATDLPRGISARDLGAHGSVSVFSIKPLSLDAAYDRTTGSSSGGFGTRSAFTASSLTSNLGFRNIYLPLTAFYSDRSLDNMTEVGVDKTVVRQSHRTRTLRFTARNSKLNATLDWTDHDDRIGSSDFSLRGIRLNHAFRWGKGSGLTSRIEWAKRRGSFPYDRNSWTEQLRLQHTRTTWSNLYYGQYASVTPGTESGGHTLGWAMDTRALSWLTAGARVTYRSDGFDQATNSSLVAAPTVAMRLRLPADLRFTGGATVGYFRRRRDGFLNGFAQVINEIHEVDQTLTVVLEQLRVDRASIVVQNEDGTLTFEELLDYQVVVVGELTELHILPGSRIIEGAELLVSYRYRPFVDAMETGFTTRFNAGLTWGPFALRHAQSRRTSVTSGDGVMPFSGDNDEIATQLLVNGQTPIGRLRLTGAHRTRRSEAFDNTIDEIVLLLGLPSVRRLQFFLDGSARWVADGEDRLRVLATGLTATWGRRSLSVMAGFRLQDWRQRLGRDEVGIAGRARISWRVGRLEANLRYTYDQRAIPGAHTVGHRLMLDLVRRF